MTLSANLVFDFMALFAGRQDAYFDGKMAKWNNPSIKVFQDHLLGNIDGIGTYPVRDDRMCKWGCIDLDGPDYDFGRAVEVWSVCQYYGVQAWIERSRSKGWHIWYFCTEWISAETMRSAGLQIAKVAQLPDNTEVNPKGIDPKATRTGLINTVRLPYPGKSDWQRQVVLEPASALVMPLDTFTEQARASRSLPAVLAGPAGMYLASTREQARTERYRTLFAKSPSLLTSRTNQEAYEVLKGSKRVVENRDNQLYTVAMLMHGVGMPYDEALARMQQIWSEQVDQTKDFYPLHLAEKKVSRAYGF